MLMPNRTSLFGWMWWIGRLPVRSFGGYLGRPFATHRDAVSELVGEVMENAVEQRLREAGVSYRKNGAGRENTRFRAGPRFLYPR